MKMEDRVCMSRIHSLFSFVEGELPKSGEFHDCLLEKSFFEEIALDRSDEWYWERQQGCWSRRKSSESTRLLHPYFLINASE